jgi:hypothetical protein
VENGGDDHDDRDHGDDEHDGWAAATAVGSGVILGQAGQWGSFAVGVCVETGFS